MGFRLEIIIFSLVRFRKKLYFRLRAKLKPLVVTHTEDRARLSAAASVLSAQLTPTCRGPWCAVSTKAESRRGGIPSAADPEYWKPTSQLPTTELKRTHDRQRNLRYCTPLKPKPEILPGRVTPVRFDGVHRPV